MNDRMRLLGIGSALLLALAISCGDDAETGNSNGDGSTGSGLTDDTGESCNAAADCYSDIARDDIQGEIRCLDRVEAGYCTHDCTIDDDCCSVDGECDPNVREVCGPFESSGMMMCFISCENEDLDGMDADSYCQSFFRDFICRSTGGGSNNRKVCVPGGGGACSIADDCGAGFLNCCDDGNGINRCYSDVDAETRNCI